MIAAQLLLFDGVSILSTTTDGAGVITVFDLLYFFLDISLILGVFQPAGEDIYFILEIYKLMVDNDEN